MYVIRYKPPGTTYFGSALVSAVQSGSVPQSRIDVRFYFSYEVISDSMSAVEYGTSHPCCMVGRY